VVRLSDDEIPFQRNQKLPIRKSWKVSLLLNLKSSNLSVWCFCNFCSSRASSMFTQGVDREVVTILSGLLQVNEALFPCELSKETTSLAEEAVESAAKVWGEKSLSELEAEDRLSYACEKVHTWSNNDTYLGVMVFWI
jgi:hypothetical protein